MSIDLNADLGEGSAFDAELMPLLSSCNIACGGHAGDEQSMLVALSLAQQHNVCVGAHPSYPDQAQFGRAVLAIEPSLLQASIIEQIAQLQHLAAQQGTKVRYVKPHGALYNQAARDPDLAQLLITSIKQLDPTLALMGLAGSVLLEQAAAAGVQTIAEGFIDRAYELDGQLRSRSLAGAVHHDQTVALQQALALAKGMPFPSYTNVPIRLTVQSLCLHSDTPQALAFAQAVRTALVAEAMTIRAAC
ncbi:5-oxoprolinase subunit PxpA [Herpetosiphon llansteffanensis]|uniref:5-oxoprolinase subunit PxpA n=1 Tax=Herpetosiphon llansteffanensis TaxID=2094568 RepID=UPI000D7B94F4|nr:5-oxoprolinase subunit PxpA [Herpetosiphon llansteffanensis]